MRGSSLFRMRAARGLGRQLREGEWGQKNTLAVVGEGYFSVVVLLGEEFVEDEVDNRVSEDGNDDTDDSVENRVLC